MHRCPVCGTGLYASRDVKIVAEHRGQILHFCSEEHKREFLQRPGAYA